MPSIRPRAIAAIVRSISRVLIEVVSEFRRYKIRNAVRPGVIAG